MKLPIEPRYLYPNIDRMNREDILKLQFKKLKYQLEYIYNNSPFYKKRFKEAGLIPDDIKSREDINRIPFLTKEDIVKDQAENPPFGNRLCVPENKIIQTWLTSGTSGLGQECYALTRMDLEYSGSGWGPWFYRAGIKKGDVVMSTWPIGTAAGPLSSYYAFQKLGCNVFGIAPYDTKSKIENYIMRFKPHGILATPAYLTHLTTLCSEFNISPRKDLPALKAIFIATEPYPVEWAKEIEEFWNTRLHEMYGSTQHGACAAATCERGVIIDDNRGFMHLDEFGTFFEVIDRKTGNHVKSGEEGELIITNLHREGSPLLRFRSNDRVRFISYEDCPCGRGFDCIEAGTIARYDDMIKMKAQNVWPEAVDSVVFKFKEIDEYNGRVFVDENGRERVSLSIEFKDIGLSDEDKKNIIIALGRNIRDRIGVSMEIKEAPKGTLERFIFKTRRWTDERKEGLKRVKYKI
jgi:phenylacetate-CoA ligase